MSPKFFMCQFAFSLAMLMVVIDGVYGISIRTAITLVPFTDHCDRTYDYNSVKLETSKLVGYSSCNDRYRIRAASDIMVVASEAGRIYMWDTDCIYTRPILDISTPGVNNTIVLDITCNYDGHYFPRFYILYVKQNCYLGRCVGPSVAHIDEYQIQTTVLSADYYPTIIFVRTLATMVIQPDDDTSVYQGRQLFPSVGPDYRKTKLQPKLQYGAWSGDNVERYNGMLTYLGSPASKLLFSLSHDSYAYYKFNQNDSEFTRSCANPFRSVASIRIDSPQTTRDPVTGKVIYAAKNLPAYTKIAEAMRKDFDEAERAQRAKIGQEYYTSRANPMERAVRNSQGSYIMSKSVKMNEIPVEPPNLTCKPGYGRMFSSEPLEMMYVLNANTEISRCDRTHNMLTCYGRRICDKLGTLPGCERVVNPILAKTEFLQANGDNGQFYCYTAFRVNPHQSGETQDYFCNIVNPTRENSTNEFRLINGIQYRDDTMDEMPQLILYVEDKPYRYNHIYFDRNYYDKTLEFGRPPQESQQQRKDVMGADGLDFEPKFLFRKLLRNHGAGEWQTYQPKVSTLFGMNVYPDLLAASPPRNERFLLGRTTVYEGEKKLPIKFYKMIEENTVDYE